MKLKTIIPSAILCMLAAGQANAQVGGEDSYQTGAPIPMAPGNPNSSTVVTPEVPSSPSLSDDYMSSLNDPSYVDTVMPSSGGATNTAAVFKSAPSNMDYDQFKSYIDKQWGVNGNAQVTASQWNSIDPAYFGGRKPSFDTLPPTYGSGVDERDLQSVYSTLYQRYQQYNAQINSSKTPW